MHCEALRICLHAFNYAGAFVGEVRRICLHAFDYAGAFVGICIVRPVEFVYIRLIMLVHLLGRPGECVHIRWGGPGGGCIYQIW